MWVQVISGRTKDPEGLIAHGRTWDTEVGNPGMLGVTAGATDDGRVISIVRFESEEVARASESSPEQQAWVEKMQGFYEGQPTYLESSETQELLGGISPQAGFVQVMRTTGANRDQVAKLDAVFEKIAGARKDLLGVFRVWTGPDSSVEAAYFTSEAEARAGESGEMPEELKSVIAEFHDMGETEYFDLKSPHIT
jgi:hypothetical protein